MAATQARGCARVGADYEGKGRFRPKRVLAVPATKRGEGIFEPRQIGLETSGLLAGYINAKRLNLDRPIFHELDVFLEHVSISGEKLDDLYWFQRYLHPDHDPGRAAYAVIGLWS